MNTIQFRADGHIMTFTTKSLTIDDKEFLFKDMTGIKHSSQNQIYVFKYGNSGYHQMKYEEKDAAKLKIIFSRIVALSNAHKAKMAEAVAKDDAQVDQSEQPKSHDQVDTPANLSSAEAEEATEKNSEPMPQAEEEAKAETAPTEATEDITVETVDIPVTEKDLFFTIHPSTENKPVISDTIIKDDVLKKSDLEKSLTEIASKENSEAEKSEDAAIANDSAEAETTDVTDGKTSGALPEVEISDTPSESVSNETTKKFKLKKSLIILAIVIAFFLVLGLVYYKYFGLSSSPNYGPNSEQTDQYNDIDELIDDLQ